MKLYISLGPVGSGKSYISRKIISNEGIDNLKLAMLDDLIESDKFYIKATQLINHNTKTLEQKLEASAPENVLKIYHDTTFQRILDESNRVYFLTRNLNFQELDKIRNQLTDYHSLKIILNQYKEYCQKIPANLLEEITGGDCYYFKNDEIIIDAIKQNQNILLESTGESKLNWLISWLKQNKIYNKVEEIVCICLYIGNDMDHEFSYSNLGINFNNNKQIRQMSLNGIHSNLQRYLESLKSRQRNKSIRIPDVFYNISSWKYFSYKLTVYDHVKSLIKNCLDQQTICDLDYQLVKKVIIVENPVDQKKRKLRIRQFHQHRDSIIDIGKHRKTSNSTKKRSKSI